MGPNTRLTLFLAAVGAASAAPAALAQRDSEFMKAFRQAQEIKARDEQANLIKTRTQEAVVAIVETCELIAKGTNDELENDIDALRLAWKDAYGTGFVTKLYEYFSVELQGEYKTARDKVFDQFVAQKDLFLRARQNKEKRALQGFGVDYLTLGRSFEELGDLYRASECYQMYAECFDEPLQAEDADYGRVIQGLDYMIEMRANLEVDDPLVQQAKARREFLVSEGYVSAEGVEEPLPAEEPPEAAPPAAPGGAAPAAASASTAPVALGGTFELVTDFEEVRRPNFTLDGIYPIWGYVFLPETGAATFGSMDDSPSVIREGFAQVKVDENGDGTGDVEVPITGNITPVEITLGEGASKRKWAFLATVGQDKDTYQGVNPYNLAPTKEALLLYVAPASSIVGTVADTRIQVYDDNMDGLYGSAPKGWAYTGLREGDLQWDFDSIRVGDSERAIPWSQYVQIGADWYEFLANDSGTDITVQKKTDLKTGFLKLDCKGVDPDYLVVHGRDKVAGVYIDVSTGGAKGVAVPAGTYELFCGRVSKGKGNQLAKACVLATPVTPPCRVEPGKTATLEIGEPFGFDFTVTQNEQEITIQGKSIAVTGRGRETYQRLWNCAVEPTISVRKGGTTKGSEEGEMRTAESSEEARDLGYETLWYPIDVTLPKKKEGEEVEVQLSEKKNKLFGKIESIWRK
jgi:hypothetical protein